MVVGLRGPVDDVEPDRPEGDADATVRLVRAVEAFDRDARARERARTVGLGRVLVLVIALALLVAIGMTVHDLISSAVQGVDRGL